MKVSINIVHYDDVLHTALPHNTEGACYMQKVIVYISESHTAMHLLNIIFVVRKNMLRMSSLQLLNLLPYAVGRTMTCGTFYNLQSSTFIFLPMFLLQHNCNYFLSGLARPSTCIIFVAQGTQIILCRSWASAYLWTLGITELKEKRYVTDFSAQHTFSIATDTSLILLQKLTDILVLDNIVDTRSNYKQSIIKHKLSYIIYIPIIYLYCISFINTVHATLLDTPITAIQSNCQSFKGTTSLNLDIPWRRICIRK
jgi:hypothetical protein